VPAPANDAPRGHAWTVFALTFGLMLSDYMSRQVINAVFPALKAEWGLSDTQLGALVSVVALTVGVMSLPVAFLADRIGRVRSATAMALLWGLATIACGLSGGFVALLAARALVGLGEAGYGSAGGAILLGVFPRRLHATVIGAFLAAALFGSVLGVIAGGMLAERFGWRWAFMAVGAAGLLLALAYPLVVREPSRTSVGDATGRMSLRAIARELLGTRTALWVYLGSGMQMFIQGAVIAWMPSYLNRYHGMDVSASATGAGLLVLVAGLGMGAGGLLVDRLSGTDRRRQLRIPAAYALSSALLLALAFGLPPGSAQLWVLAAGLFVGAGFAGASGATIAAVTHPAIHASSLAMLTLANNVLGLAPGPLLTGVLADRFGLSLALGVVPLAGLVAVVAYVKASRCLPEDLRRCEPPGEGADAA
jgi:MFS family permease